MLTINKILIFLILATNSFLRLYTLKDFFTFSYENAHNELDFDICDIFSRRTQFLVSIPS